MKLLFPCSVARILLFTLIVLAFQSRLHAASFELPLNLDGTHYIAVVSPNDALMTQIRDDNPSDNESDQHYLGELANVENSWVRVSNIAGVWHGVAFAFQQMFVIDSSTVARQRLPGEDTGLLSARPISSLEHTAASCGLDITQQRQSTDEIFSSDIDVATPESALVLPQASDIQQRTFNELCTNKVSDGIGGELCLIAELELAFDQEFQTAVGNTSPAVATSIINVVDGIYRNNFNISFETLSRTMMTNANDVFSNTTDAGGLLNSVSNQKQADAIPFITNPNALFHLVTGRDFDGSTAGVANLNALCRKGSATGISKLLGSSSSRVALTAAVIAHELGHNFGSGHDGQENSCDFGHIMWPSVNRDTQTFSTCSKSAITTAIGNIENNSRRAPLNSCFNFPVDLGVVANGGNPSNVTRNQTFATAFVLTPKQAAQEIDSATFSGSVTGGTIESTSIPGQACTVAPNQLSFSCSLSNFTAAANAAIELKASADQLNLSLDTSVSGAQLRDIVSANDTLAVQIVASGGGASDSTPDAFSFTDQTGVARSETIISNAITISGIDIASPVSVSGGEYSVNNGAFTSAAGIVVNGNTIRLRHSASVLELTTVETVLSVGGVSDTFSSTTAVNPPTDTTPDAFSFTDVVNVARSSVQTSNAVTISGIDTASPVSIVGGRYSINGQAFTSSAGTLVNGNTVRVRHDASATAITQTNTTLTIGGVSDTFSSTTAALPVDTTPDAFSFSDVTDVGLSTEQTSNSITVSGINAASPVSIVNGSYSIDGQAFTTVNSTAQSGDTIRVRHTSSASAATTTDSLLTIGGVSDTFSSTTRATTPVPVPPTSPLPPSSGAGSLSLLGLLWLLSSGWVLAITRRAMK